MDSKIINAIKSQNVITFDYEEQPRTVEPHCYGITTKGNEVIRAYQIDGYSSSGRMGWKLYDISKIEDLSVLDETFEIEEGYKRGDKGMSEIFYEL